MASDPYSILGVSKSANDADIKTAYRKLAKKHHPDLNPSKDDTKFKDISAAYDLLSDKDKKAAFDRGEIDMDGQPKRQQQYYRDHAQGPQGKRYTQSSGEGPGMADFEDLFSMFGGRGAGFRQQSQDVQYSIDIDFMEAALGSSKRVTLPDGRSLDITVPAGIEEGKKLRLKGQGVNGKGDAYVQIHIREHKQFTRKGQDIFVETPIGFHESVLGSKIQVPTIHGPVDMVIPKGASSGMTLRLKGKGIKQGDQFVKLKIVMPPVDGELERVVSEWAKTHAYNPRREKA